MRTYESEYMCVEDTSNHLKLFYVGGLPYVVFTDRNGKTHTRRCTIIDKEYKLCSFRFNKERLQRRFF